MKKIRIAIDKKKTDPDNIVDINEVELLDDSSCEEIYVDECLDYLPYKDRFDMLKTICKKLVYDGIITVSGVDMTCLGSTIFSIPRSSSQVINENYLNGRVSIVNLKEVRSVIEEMNFEIDTIKVDNMRYSIKAKRILNEHTM